MINETQTFNIIEAKSSDIEEMKSVLKSYQLPTEDIDFKKSTFWIIRDGKQIIACVGLEQYKPFGLVRSLGVNKEYRNLGLAIQLHNEVLQYARSWGMHSLYLLTTTADKFFEKQGWIFYARTAVPEVLKQTAEFTNICPNSAVCMKYDLTYTSS
jgi:N-acetylglutamate synthase-like GNAT family acetyltransferase